MAKHGTYEAVRRALQDFVLPDLKLIERQNVDLLARIDALNVKLDAGSARLSLPYTKAGALSVNLDAKTTALGECMGALDTKVEAVRSELRSFEKRLDETLNIRERLAALESTLRAMQHQ